MYGYYPIEKSPTNITKTEQLYVHSRITRLGLLYKQKAVGEGKIVHEIRYNAPHMSHVSVGKTGITC